MFSRLWSLLPVIGLLIIFQGIGIGQTPRRCPEAKDLKTGKPILVGEFRPTCFLHKPYRSWFKKEWRAYAPDSQTLKHLKREHTEDLRVEIILGTWCGDSKREVPRFLKIWKKTHARKPHLIGVDRGKLAPGIDLIPKHIEKVPTFIFYRNGVEVGRIIESPVESLEKDLVRILTDPETPGKP